MKKFWNTYKTWIIVAVVALLASWFFFGGKGGDENKLDTIVATRGTIEEVVNVTGKVKPSKEVNMSFERGGVVRSVNTEVDQVVNKGAVLATISNGDVYGRLQEAQAGLDSARATLDQLTRGARDEEKRLKQTALESANQDLANAYLNVPDTLRNVYTNASDAVRVKLSALFDGRSGSSYRLNFSACDSQSEIDATNLRLDADVSLRNMQSSIDTFSVIDQNAIDTLLKNVTIDMQKIDTFVRRTNDLLSVSCALANKDLDQYRTSVTLAKIPVNAALTELSTRKNTIASQKLLVKRAQNDLDLTLAGSDVERIRAQEAAVKQAQARVNQVYADVSQTVITAPFTGRVTKVDAKVGQYTSPSVPVIVMISDSTFEIEAKIPEVDIKRIAKENPAIVWLDAFQKDVLFDAFVRKIDPAATVSDGVPTYVTTLEFAKKDDRIKSGMTANIDIVTSKKENVITLPARAIQTGSIVRVQVDGAIKDVQVERGVRGRNGEVEIAKGLVGGEVIVVGEVK